MASLNFERDGLAIFRGALPIGVLESCQKGWLKYAGNGRMVEFNPVSVSGPFPFPLDELPRIPSLLDIVEQAFGPDIALYAHRFVVKDRHSRGPVFIHQDTGYHLGFPRKASLFVALSSVAPGNGGMIFCPGTHKYGYLGDSGEIAEQLVREHPSVSPTLEPGDCVLMDSALWHGSHRHLDGPDRIMADIIVQPANDPTGIELLRGEWRCTPKTFLRDGTTLFKRSRTSRLKELQAIVDTIGDRAEP